MVSFIVYHYKYNSMIKYDHKKCPLHKQGNISSSANIRMFIYNNTVKYHKSNITLEHDI